MVKYILYIYMYVYTIYIYIYICVCVCMYVMDIPISAMFSYIFPWDFGSKNPEKARNGWSFAGLSPRHRGRSLGTGCPAAVPRGADPDVSRAIRRSPGTARQRGNFSWWKVSVMWNAGDGVVLALVFFRNKMVKHGYVMIYIYIYICMMMMVMVMVMMMMMMMMIYHVSLGCSLHVTLSSCWGSKIKHSWCDARGKGLVGLACGSILLANHS